MTRTESLSARIAALEAQAAPLPELNAEVAELISRCNDVSAQIHDAVQARQLLDELEGHAERLFGSGEGLNSESNSESIPVITDQSEAILPLIEEAKTPASTENDVLDAALDTINAFVNSDPNSAFTPELTLDALEVTAPPALASTPVDSAGEEPPTYVPQTARFAAWLDTVQPGAVITAASTAETLDMPATSVRHYLRDAVKAGRLEMVPGTGKADLHGTPAQYRRPQPQAGEGGSPPPETGPLRPRPTAVPKAHIAAPVTPLSRDLPPMKASAQQPTPQEIELILGCLTAHGRAMSRSLLLARLSRSGIKQSTLDAALAVLEGARQVQTNEHGHFLLATPQEDVA